MSPILTLGPESRWRVVLTGGRLGLPSNHEPHRRTSRAIAISGGFLRLLLYRNLPLLYSFSIQDYYLGADE
jgi:hypothetical protein